jgi:hypothetical protein
MSDYGQQIRTANKSKAKAKTEAKPAEKPDAK